MTESAEELLPRDPQGVTSVGVLRLSFVGSGHEYFAIWISNLLLIAVTLGIYSPWAKVRRLRYLYANTRLADSGFEYTGRPMAILKGRVIAVVLLAGYQAVGAYLGASGAVLAMLAFALAAPWLIWKSFQFKLYNTRFRGLRLGFAGSLGGAYRTFLGLPLLLPLTLLLLGPFVHQRIKRYQHANARYGAARFRFEASVGGFYVTYLLVIGASLAVLAMPALVVASQGQLGSAAPGVLALGVPVALIGYWFISALLVSRLQNLVWNGTLLEEARFQSEVRAWPMTRLMLVNALLTIVTLGLFTPFAKVRSLRYRLGCVTVEMARGMDDFLAGAQQEADALGSEVVDLLDVDFSL